MQNDDRVITTGYTFYRYKSAVVEGSIDSLFDQSRQKPNMSNRVDEKIEKLPSTLIFPFFLWILITLLYPLKWSKK